MQEVVPLFKLGSPKVVPTFGQELGKPLSNPAGCNSTLVYELTPADTYLSFSWLRFTYPPVVSGKR